MMFQKTVAQRQKVKLMLALAGPSGSGKTYSALQLAYGMTKDWKKIALTDTENKSALYYAGADKTGEWQHIDFPSTLKAGYHPNNWIELISFVERDPTIEVLILDSISHEWQGTGGCLQLVELYSRDEKGNTFAPWKKVTPLHNAFIDKMRNSRLHIIATMRSTPEYAIEKNEKGKNVPKKIGLKPTQREGTDFEFGIIFDIDADDHYAKASKDRTGIFANRPAFLITPEIGDELTTWSNSGIDPASLLPKPQLYDQENSEHIVRLEKILRDMKIPETDWGIVSEHLHGKEMTPKTVKEICKKIFEGNEGKEE